VIEQSKLHISTKPSAYQNIYFVSRPYFVQNKYVPHKNNSRPPRGGLAPLFGNLRARVLNFQQRDENIRLAIQGSNLDLPVFSYMGKCCVNYMEYFVACRLIVLLIIISYICSGSVCLKLNFFNAETESKKSQLKSAWNIKLCFRLMLSYVFLPLCVSWNMSEKELSGRKWTGTKPDLRQTVNSKETKQVKENKIKLCNYC
jgi:hypothetical protein